MVGNGCDGGSLSARRSNFISPPPAEPCRRTDQGPTGRAEGRDRHHRLHQVFLNIELTSRVTSSRAAPTHARPRPPSAHERSAPLGAPLLTTMPPLRITSWNVNGIRNPFGYQPWRDKRSFDAMFDLLEADIVVLQELKIQRKDLTDDMVLVPGWDCYFSLPKHKKGARVLR